LSGGYIVVVDGRRSSISERSFDWRTSTRVPFVPPFGTIYVAWDQSRVEQWLSRSPHVVTAAERAHFEEAWSVVRASGYAVLGWADARARVAELLAGLDVAPLSDEVTLIEKFARQALSYEEYLLTDLRPSQSYTVNGISAPLFDNDGSVDMTITVEFASRSLVGTQIEHYGERIRMAAASIGDEVRGLPGSSTKA
jgi:DNA-binding IclR family transcriptional regulator